MPFEMPTLPGMGRTPPIQPQQQQIIDPRAEYERQSLLADQLAQMATGYDGGGWGEALGDIIAAYRSNKMGQKAEGSLSAAIAQEEEKAQAAAREEMEAAQRAREEAFEDFKRKEQFKNKNAPPPSAIRELQAAGIDPRSPEGQAIIARGRGTNVNVNTGEAQSKFLYGSDAGLPAGWRIDTQTGQASRIPGGPAEAEQQETEQKEQGREQQTEIKQGIMTDDIARALEVVEGNPNLAAGPLSVVGQFLNVGPANRLESALETIEPNIAFDRLDEMRQNSPTGGAVGQLSDSERKALGSVLGSLRQTQNPEDLQYNLKRLNNILVDAQHGRPEQRQALIESGQIPPELNAQIEALYMPLEREEEQPQQQGGNPEIDNLLKKYGQ